VACHFVADGLDGPLRARNEGPFLRIKSDLYPGGRFQMQFSVHTTDEEARRKLVPVKEPWKGWPPTATGSSRRGTGR